MKKQTVSKESNNVQEKERREKEREKSMKRNIQDGGMKKQREQRKKIRKNLVFKQITILNQREKYECKNIENMLHNEQMLRFLV
jgi:hypothetical protein